MTTVLVVSVALFCFWGGLIAGLVIAATGLINKENKAIRDKEIELNGKNFILSEKKQRSDDYEKT